MLCIILQGKGIGQKNQKSLLNRTIPEYFINFQLFFLAFPADKRHPKWKSFARDS